MRALVVDDIDVQRHTLARLLEKSGHSVATAQNGREAVDMCASEPFDIIFMDCNMPVMDGVSAAREIRRRGYAAMPIIAVSAEPMAEQKPLCLSAGMNDFIPKPVRASVIEAALTHWLAARESGGAILAAPHDDITEAPANEASGFDSSIMAQWKSELAAEPFGTLIALTLKDAASTADRLRAALRSSNGGEARENAHALKSIAAQVGGTALAAICRDIETSCRSGNTDDCIRFIEDFESSYDSFTKRLHEYAVGNNF